MNVDAAIAHIPRLRRYARVLLGDANRADDLVQDTLERACQKWGLWKPPPAASAEAAQKALVGWLLTIMHNLYANQWQQAVRQRTDSLDESNESGHDPTAQITLRLDLERALACLAPPSREVLLLVAMEQFSYVETADMLGVPLGTVMSRLSRAREQLRQFMENGQPAPATNKTRKGQDSAEHSGISLRIVK